jgi:hypothetical protein
VKGQAIVKFITCQKNKIVDRFGRIDRKQVKFNIASAGFNGSPVRFFRVNDHIRIFAVFLCHKNLL